MHVKTITKNYQIMVPVQAVWEALTNPHIIEKWSGATAIMTDQKGTKFSLWAGEIHGTNSEVIANKKLVQDWYSSDNPHATKVTFLLSSDNEHTTLELIHENVEDTSYKDLDDGWDRYYLGAIKKYLENGGETK